MIRRRAMSGAPGVKLHATLVRAPLISRIGAFNNEAAPHLGIAYVAGYARKFGHTATVFENRLQDAFNRRKAPSGAHP